jgi:hypothetical protein
MLTQSEITELMATLIKAGREDQQSGARGSAEMGWVDRIHGNGFSYEIREGIAEMGQGSCFAAYSAAWFLQGTGEFD